MGLLLSHLENTQFESRDSFNSSSPYYPGDLVCNMKDYSNLRNNEIETIKCVVYILLK